MTSLLFLGAGKTTLLNYIAGRNLSSRSLVKQGKILINGKDSAELTVPLSILSAYVQQDDVLFQTLSVRECLEFAAKLKLKGSYESKIRCVDKIIKELNL